MSLDDKLSLGNFDAARANAPYLNTPRSLEACRRHGIRPSELVEISLSEFIKNAPNSDSDISQRIFDRVDGARRILLENVTKEWQKICSGGSPTRSINETIGESIVDAPIESHSTLLEIQVIIKF